MSACQRAYDAEERRIDAAHADLDTQLCTDTAKLAKVNERLALLRPLAESKHLGRWWTSNWWRATFSGAWKEAYRESEAARDRLEENVERARARLRELDDQKEQLVSAFERNRKQLIDEETTRRGGEFDRQAASLVRGQALLEQEWK